MKLKKIFGSDIEDFFFGRVMPLAGIVAMGLIGYGIVEPVINTNNYALIVEENEALILPRINDDNFVKVIYKDDVKVIGFTLNSGEMVEFELGSDAILEYFNDVRTEDVIEGSKLSITPTGTIHMLDVETGHHELIKGSDERILRP